MVPAERLQVLVELLRILERLHGGDDRVQQPRALHVHVHGEEVPQVRVGQEHAGVEVAGDLVLMLLDEAPALLEQASEVSHAFRVVRAVRKATHDTCDSSQFMPSLLPA
jgi:hypothetical protein